MSSTNCFCALLVKIEPAFVSLRVLTLEPGLSIFFSTFVLGQADVVHLEVGFADCCNGALHETIALSDGNLRATEELVVLAGPAPRLLTHRAFKAQTALGHEPHGCRLSAWTVITSIIRETFAWTVISSTIS